MLLRPLYFLLLLTLGATQLTACAQVPDKVPTAAAGAPAAAQLPWLRHLLDSSAVLRPHLVGLVLADADSGQVLFAQNDAKYFAPASNMKLFTLYAGLKLLPDSLPSLRYFSRGDTLFFQGTGDPTFLHGDVPSRRAFDFLQKAPGLLASCDIACSPPYGPGWPWDDFGYYFQPERGAFPIYGHTVRFYAQPPVGKVPSRLRVLPRHFAPLTGPVPAALRTPNIDADTHVIRALDENRFYVVAPFNKKWIDEVPFRTSRAFTLRLLGDTLRRPLVGAPWRPRPTDAVRTLRGLPVDSLYRRMLRVSDNFLAEQLLLMASTTVGLHDSLSTQRVIRFVRKKYFGTLPDPVAWADGSGLSRQNLVTPRTLVALLVRLHQEVPERRLLSLLAAGGHQGTLRRRYHDAAGPWVWGKTGSLTNNTNLSGYLRTKSGRLLAFTFLNNNHVADSGDVRNEMERVLRQVRARL
ncbi:D-alanyl-D-alanine carboxypeptidase/D-alanyl-D-alanine-endopeptidase [Hymenobacter caeli]|uniref:D-alanyl-D-alanine carboxypeptidase/D-alanyl-D-alanine-endopeptidase (Penicillin-binding protein 4) n=1 Tax=Hymenobacter caeli TaxID=2735894 RepID=A0ABX2FUF2_9BACT|nr:D-alanyl-D-alanine carboxypeptidase/D-alanyl-D-alanine-endopeptidase [Hymenobacter caeli]NRT19969.1 D-alanyl-D-alanine carboxypeptidase/D-alanyl-D-alanine-endopeptidase (penicillin-binding protein 4) [Hymenobacter caeli]